MGQRIAIVVAGGSGTRMGNETPKQFLPLRGKPMLMHTVEKFVGVADRIIVVLPSGHRVVLPQGVEECTGGATRFESVKNALAYIGTKGHATVAIHDGVRPLVSHELIESAFVEAELNGTAIPRITPVDSFRFEGVPVDRNKLMAVQTPQAFRLDILIAAYDTAGTDFTDDASVVEAAGYTLHFIEGERENIKITTPADLRIAQILCE